MEFTLRANGIGLIHLAMIVLILVFVEFTLRDKRTEEQRDYDIAS